MSSQTVKDGDKTILIGALAVLLIAILYWVSIVLANIYPGGISESSNPKIILNQISSEGLPNDDSIYIWLFILLLLPAIFGYKYLTRDKFDILAKKLPIRGLKRYSQPRNLYIGSTLKKPTRKIGMNSEDTLVVLAGPRTGKTTTQAIPMALNHDGPVIVTSNKADIYYAIKDQRRIRLVDPQQLAGKTIQEFFFNPINNIKTVPQAKDLAKIFRDAQSSSDDKHDYFDQSSVELISLLILASAYSDRRITTIYEWLINSNSPDPINILKENNFKASASSLQAIQTLPDEQKSGIYGTATQTMEWVQNPENIMWAERDERDLDSLDIDSFLGSDDVLMLLSKESNQSSAALNTAIVSQILEKAEIKASNQPNGYLQTPLLAILDEAANICKWQNLPNLYSHYGSRHIMLASFFQSWAQIQEAYGVKGGEKLLSASNIVLYLGGINDTGFLKRLSELCGTHEKKTFSSTSSFNNNSKTQSQRKEEILDVASLSSMPANRAIALLSQASPTVLVTRPYWK